ncbi:MAG: hypothetical protein K9M99_03655 [Candidatus Cloacimonetes bacterium]|nr:hypothetical protein [Candidatus Cloacimonadota bacterium]
MPKNKLHDLSRTIIDRGYLKHLKYLHADSNKGSWYYYDGKKWVEDCAKEHEISIKSFYIDHIDFKPTDADYITDLPKLSSCQQWNNILRITRTEPEISCVTDDFDAKLELLNLENGTYDLATAEYREHRACDMLTKLMGVEYIPEAKCTRFIKFMDEVFSGDTSVIEYLHRYLGYCLSDSTAEQCFLFFWGSGSNGKSVLTELLYHIFGDFGKKISNQAITYSRRGSERDRQDQIKASLKNVRLAFATETGQNMRLDEAAVKDMTGGETIIARDLYASYESFTPVFKLIMSGNYQPEIVGTDLGIWRRIRLISFNRTFQGDDIDPQLLNTLLKERNGIFQWILEGYHLWKESGLGELPESIRDDIADYRSDMDILGQYIEEKLVQESTAITETEVIFNDYRNWMEENGHSKIVTKRKLTSELMKRGFVRDNTNIHKPKFIGIGLLAA